MGIGIMLRQRFEWFLRRMEVKFHKWSHKPLSLLGRLTIAHSVLESATVYVASILPFSKKACKEFARNLQDFVWQGNYHSINWQTITSSKEGGLGLKPLKEKVHKLNAKWIAKLDMDQPWAVLVRF